MGNYDDFGDILVPDFDMPANVPTKVEGEARQYYRHPTGTYLGFVGKTIHKFKNAEGKYVESNEPGAIYHNSMVQAWITKFLGDTQNPVGDILITPDLKIPDRPMQECYFPLSLSRDPKRLWAMIAMFKNWKIPGHEKYNIIQPAQTNPNNKEMHLGAFPAYQGLSIKFSLTYKAEEGKSADEKSRYVDGEVEILDYKTRISAEKLTAFYKDADARFEKEREERKARQTEGGYTPEAAPNTNFDALGAGGGDSLDDFIK